MSVMRVIVFYPHTELEVRGHSHSENMAVVTPLIGLVTLTVRSLNGVGSQVTRVMGVLPANSELAMPFHSRLRVRRGIDRWTDNGRRHIMLQPYGAQAQ